MDRQENYISTDDPDTTGHGGDVLELLGYFAPESVFNLYRVIARNGTARRGDLVEAIADPSTHGIDLLNLSVGIYHGEEEDESCGGMCRVADEARLAIEDGMPIVAAAGHRTDTDERSVFCPALLDDAISVGGFVSQCGEGLIDTVDSGQYWVRDENIVGPFCGQRGCSPSKSCEDYRYECQWMGNVSFHNTTPDVLAPVHHPIETEGGALLQSGTSFGTPVITGLLAVILSDLLELGVDPSPAAIHTAVTDGAVELDDGDGQKFNASNTWDILSGD